MDVLLDCPLQIHTSPYVTLVIVAVSDGFGHFGQVMWKVNNPPAGAGGSLIFHEPSSVDATVKVVGTAAAAPAEVTLMWTWFLGSARP